MRKIIKNHEYRPETIILSEEFDSRKELKGSNATLYYETGKGYYMIVEAEVPIIYKNYPTLIGHEFVPYYSGMYKRYALVDVKRPSKKAEAEAIEKFDKYYEMIEKDVYENAREYYVEKKGE